MAKKKITVEFLVKEKKEIELDIPEGAEIQSFTIDGKTILKTDEELSELASVLGSLGYGALKIGGNEVPVGVLLGIIKLLPGLIEKIGVTLA